MKIIALIPGSYSNKPGAIVQLEPGELARICGGNPNAMAGTPTIGMYVEVCKRFDHAQDILNEAAEAKKLPQALRAFADTLETLHPAIDAIIDPVIDASFEVK